MASGHHNQWGVPENLRKQLAFAVRNIQWSYAVFWSISSRHPGVLEWGDGYYNGDIKTRRTVQALEFNADRMGLLRSDQLRELYESLAADENWPQARRPSAALSPEDLTDTEWYYLVCMSFMFNIGQCLPGRTLANNQPIWLCNAPFADSKVFCRSLLAMSASIQTVVCFPYLGGVIELGVTELIVEDPSPIQHVLTSFLKIPFSVVSKTPRSVSGNAQYNKDCVYAKLDQEILGVMEVCSPNSSSNRTRLHQQAEELFMIEGLNDEISNCVNNSTSSSDCISQTLINPEKVSPILKENDDCLIERHEDNPMKMSSSDIQIDEIHYQSIVSTLLKSSHQLVLGPHFQNYNQESSFVSWKKGGFAGIQMPKIGTPQRLVKKILFEVARMHGDCLLDSREDNGRGDGLWIPQVDDINSSHVLAERRRREKIKERFLVLGSLVPSTNKVDKVSILDHTIEHLEELKRRVEELESCMVAKRQDSAEWTSDNNGNDHIGNRKKASKNKRKASDINEMETEINRVLLKDKLTDNVTVSTIEKDVVIEIRCPWREFVLLEIVDAISRLHLDSHSVQSTNIDGILSLTIKSKFKGSKIVSTGMIRQTLQRLVQKN
uniref:GL3c n=1 Tax=Camellia sinensis TaxID=4442 RepID=A0A7D5PXI6_CAMSI|nr:GL3c [Camellia sinensis]